MSLPINETRSIQIKADWEINPRAVPAVANQVMLRMAAGSSGAPSGVQVTLGYIGGPVLPNEPAPGLPPVELTAPIVVVGDYYLSLDTAENLHEVLGRLIGDLKSGPYGAQ